MCTDGIILDYLLFPKYRQIVTTDTLHPPNGIAFPRASTSHFVINGHCDPFVHLGHIIFPIQHLRDYLWDDYEIKMSEYLLFEMIYCGVDELNNVLWFITFANLHFNAWFHMELDPIPEGTSFLDAYQVWLHCNYPINDRKAGKNGVGVKGTVWYGATNKLPRLSAACHRNIRFFHDAIKDAAKKKPTEKEYGALIKLLNKHAVGTGKLKLQKMVYVAAVLDGNLPIVWIWYCISGSKEHHEHLQERKQSF
jgi:hypothetical protein